MAEFMEATSDCKGIERGLRNRIVLRIYQTISQNVMSEL